MPRKTREEKEDERYQGLTELVEQRDRTIERLTVENQGLRKDHEDAMEEVKSLKGEVTRHLNRVRDLEERLKYELRRAAQALDVAEEAAHAAGSIGRVTSMLTSVLESLDRKLNCHGGRD